jgi:hypothetical protein
MLKWLKRICLTLLVVIALLAVWIQIGSIDKESFDDRGLLSELKPVPDAENGFLDLAYMGEDNFKFSGVKERNVLQDSAYGKKWNSEESIILLDKNKELLDNIKASNAKQSFALPDIKGDPLKYFSYSKLSDANRFLIIESRVNFQALNYDKAIESIRHALIFSEHVKTEKSGYMLSWMVGYSMQKEVLQWIHEAISLHDLDPIQYRNILIALRCIAPYKTDGFSRIFPSELKFVLDLLEAAQEKTIEDKNRHYKKTLELFDTKENQVSLIEKWHFYLTTLFPEFYVHNNRIMEANALSMENLVEKAGDFCLDARFPEENIDMADYSVLVENPGWRDFLLPNSLGRRWPVMGSIYNEYFQRRCFFHVYTDAIEIAVAIKAYEKQHNGALPETLDALVPNYLDRLPIDYFDGQALRYSRERQWLYSVGADGKDDGGSAEGFYQGRCKKEDACFNNPTIPLSAPQPMQ